MSVVSANDQTARDRSPVHGLHGFVCFRESRFVTCVDKPVSFQHCTATILCHLEPISCVSTMTRSSSSFVSYSTVRPQSATQSSPSATTSASQWTNYTIIGVFCSNLQLKSTQIANRCQGQFYYHLRWQRPLTLFVARFNRTCTCVFFISGVLSHRVTWHKRHFIYRAPVTITQYFYNLNLSALCSFLLAF